MSNPENATSVNILGKEYIVTCTDEERSALLDAASFLDKKMREIRDSGKVIGTDRIAVMAALNIAHDLLNKEQAPAADATPAPHISERIHSLQNRIEDALYRSRQLEI